MIGLAKKLKTKEIKETYSYGNNNSTIAGKQFYNEKKLFVFTFFRV